MRPSLSGNVLFVFSDPGGAKPCLSLAEESKLSNVILASDRAYPFYKDFRNPVTIIHKGFEQFIEAFDPSLIFTGTSYTSYIERRFIQIARQRKTPCYAFVDHWTAIADRFKNIHGQMVLPDQVWVLDSRAKNLAIAQGINEERIIITGNPYHDWLKNWVPSASKETYLQSIGLNDHGKKILVYAPDPLSNINGIEKYGFDEITATATLVSLFCSNKDVLKNWKVLVKAHPNQNREKLQSIIAGCPSFSLLYEDVDTNTTLFYADVVVGLFSSILTEAAIMNKPVLRFLDGNVSEDPLADLNIGSVTDKDSFVTILTEDRKWN